MGKLTGVANCHRSQQALKPVNREEMERSGEGSAPNGSGNGGANGSGNCSKDGNGNSRVNPGSGGNGNGNSATKQCEGSNQPNGESGNNGNGNSATKADNLGMGNGNSGNDASTSRQVCHPFYSTLTWTESLHRAAQHKHTATTEPAHFSVHLAMHTSYCHHLKGRCACVQEVAALQGTAQGGKRYRLTEEAGAELRSATEEQGTDAGMQPQSHAPLKQRPADGVRPAKAYRGEYSRAGAVNENDNGIGIVGSTTALAGSLPGDFLEQSAADPYTAMFKRMCTSVALLRRHECASWCPSRRPTGDKKI